MSEDLCEFLPWDSEHFGVRIGRVLPTSLGAEELQSALCWATTNAIDCLYLLAGADDAVTMRAAELAGFRLTDVRLTLDRKLANIPEARARVPVDIRPAQLQDIPALRALARVSHRDTRFYFDGHFSPGDCDRLYDVWIEKSCNGWADLVMVALHEDRPVAYTTGHLRTEGYATVGLVAVDATQQGLGIGPALVNATLVCLQELSAQHVSVVTQGRNIAAQRLYQRCGFMSKSTELWYHLWNIDRQPARTRPGGPRVP